MSDALYAKPATVLAAAIANRDLSVVEVIDAYLDRIEAINPTVNAIVTLCAEEARAQAQAMDKTFAAGVDNPLYGLPIAIKDLVLTRGIRTTMGSPIYANNVPDVDELFVERLKAAGAIIIGKTNTPEFGAGSQTFNPVFGATRNPYALDRTCGGSSGGAAVALACEMLPIADGNDLGGSLRNPASFCNVVGFRPSPGRVPNWPKQFSSDQFGVTGPMARTVEDAALLLSVMAGPDPRVPISILEPGAIFREPLGSDLTGLRFAWSPDLGGNPVDAAVTSVLEDALPVFTNLGATVEIATPDLRDAEEIFCTFRAWMYLARLAEDYEQHGEMMKETLRWNIEQGRKLTLADLTSATVKHSELIERVAGFFDNHDFLLCPAAQVPPVPARAGMGAIDQRHRAGYLP